MNLTELATGFRHHAQIDSNFKRLQRFFRSFELDYSLIARTIVRIMDIPQPWVLSTDRTEWSFGKTRFNILMLGIVHNGVAYPLVWEMLDKKGNSHSDERMDLIDRFRTIFPDAEIAYLTGDRELVGKQWLTYLLIEPIIPFRLRIKKAIALTMAKRNLERRLSLPI